MTSSPLEPLYWHLFLDTTEIYNSRDYVAVPSQGPPFAHLRYYVSKLSVEERVVQLLEDVNSLRADLEQFSGVLGFALPTSSKSDSEFRDHFRTEITSRLNHANVTVFDPYSHDAEEQMMLFTERHQGGYKDAMVIASAITFAAENHLPQCFFVTNEKNIGHFSGVAKALGSRRHIRTTVISRSDLNGVINFKPDVLDPVITLVQPKFEERAVLIKPELIKHALADPQRTLVIWNAEMARHFVDVFSREDADLSTIDAVVFNLHPLFVGPLLKKERSRLRFRMIVVFRYAPAQYSRMYNAFGEVSVLYDGTKFSDPQVVDFNVDWIPVG